MLRVDIDLDRSALFSPSRARRIVDDMVNQAEREIAKEADRLIHQHLGRVLRHPTGFYESNVTAHPHAGGWVVDDNGVVYGPWLEGTGSRNSPVSRFKGYAHFRRARRLMERQSVRITERVVARNVRRLTS